MIHIPIIKAVYCPLSDQLHSITLCEQLCDEYYEGCTSKLLQCYTVMCPCINKLVDIGSCADGCDYYESDGIEVEYMMCSYEEIK